MNHLKLSKEKEIELFVLCIWLFLIRIALPYAKYFFVPYFIFFVAYTIFRILTVHDVIQFKSYYFRTFSAFLLVCMFFFIGILLSSKLDFYFLKEGLAMFVQICIWVMAFVFIENEVDFKLFTRIFMRQLMIFCIFICFFSLVKLFFLLRGVKFEFLYNSYGLYTKGTSLVIDYNFFSLVNILGIVTAFFLLVKERSTTRSVLLQLLVFCLIINVMFSTSRRGIVVLALIILFLLFVFLFGWVVKKGTLIAILSGKLKLVFIVFFGFISLLFIFLSQRPFHSESSRYINLGFDRITGRDLFYVCAVRYYTLIDPQCKDSAMNQYFERFRKTGQVEVLNNSFKFNTKTNALKSGDSLKFNSTEKINSEDYLSRILNDPDNLLSGGRIQHFNFGIKIFSEQYSPSQKIIGGGFDYLWDFGHEFYYKNKNRFYFDYPHNPILSAVLYSGILGGLSLLYFFCMTFLNFIWGFRSLIYFICLYVIMFLFAFFSGNSIFGNPEFVFVSLVPFYFTIVKYRGQQKFISEK